MTERNADSFRDVLRAIPTRPEERPVLRAAALPSDPLTLLRAWLREEAESGTAVPHAFALATVAPGGVPEARTVVLKELDDAVCFASSSRSAKGIALESSPIAEAVFYWARSGRQVRVRGRVEPAGRAESDADFRARHPMARAAVVLGRQGTPLDEPEVVERLLDDAAASVRERPDEVPQEWTAYRLVPDRVDVLQLRAASAGERVGYSRAGAGWSVVDLWP